MSLEAFVSELNGLGIFPFVEAGKLKTRAVAQGMPADIAARIRAHKDGLIAFLGGNTVGPAIAAEARPDGRYPLSFAQRRLWFIEQLEGGGSQYNMPTAVELEGRVDSSAIEWALDQIVQRHAVLRSTYGQQLGEPVQLVHPHRAVVLRRHDLRDVPAAQHARQLEQVLQAEYRHPFDLGADLMLRALLVSVGAQRHVLVITLHHIACDGWSKGVLTREFVALYRQRCGGPAAALAPLPIQYADYAQWQAGDGYAARMQAQLDYWSARLADIPHLHALPLDRPRPAVQQFASAIHLQQLAPALLQRLEALARAHDATLFMLLQSAFALLIGRLSQERTVAIGSPVAGRVRQELEPLIGFFVNTLVFKTELGDGGPFSALLSRNRTAALDAYANQDIPFEMLVERLQPERSLSHAPLFQILFALQNNDYTALDLPEVRISGLPITGLGGRFDLELLAGERDGGLLMSWNFATSLFDAATVASMAASFEVLLEGICADPHCDIDRLPLTTAADLHRLRQWRDVQARALPGPAGIHQMFEQAARATPDATALVFGRHALSYAELNGRANRLAHVLIARGAGPDQLIGISIDRSLELVVAVLAVLKAGAAYVALDPAYPRARLEYMLDDSAVATVLTTRRGTWDAPHARGLALFVEDDSAFAAAPQDDPRRPVDPEQLAYVIYTSGSTGKPKGIVLPHRVLTNLVGSQYARYPAMAGALPTLQFATLNFDMSIYEIMTALCNGSTLVMLEEEERLSLPRLCELLQQQRIGRLYLPTAMLATFCQHALAEAVALPALELVQVAGEALTINREVRDFFAAWPQAGLLNLYGPSETHVITDLLLDADPAGWPVAPSIGHAILNSELYVLDAHMNEVPPGAVGELYAGGPCLARGYLNLPQMTAEKFCTPLADRPGLRLYRTGDLVRYNADGSLAYLGRIGRQVKVHGFRIELDEIEHCLLGDPRVADAVVLARGDGADKTLAAYVVLAANAGAGAIDQVRAALADTMPGYMIPSSFTVLERFALTANGKVDTARLPAPYQAARDEYVAPAPGLEQQMAQIWADLLKRPLGDIGANAGFFALGGHSLLAMRMVNRVEQSLGIKLTVRAVFAQPVLRALCASVAGGPRRHFEALRGVDRSGPLPLSYSQQRLWYIDQLEGGSTQYHLPLALRLHGPLDRDALRSSLARIVERHEILRTVYRTCDGAPRQQVLPPSPLALPCIDLTSAGAPVPQEELVSLLRRHALTPFDLTRDPMVRAHLFQLGPDQHVLLCTMHHIASDGWSIGVLARELSVLYADAAAALAPLPLQYGDFAAWQRDPVHQDTLAAQLDYWRGQLAGLPPVHDLPLDRERPARATYEGGNLRQLLAPGLCASLREFVTAGDASLFMCLHGVLGRLLMRWSNANEFVIGSPIAGRTRGDLDDSIGMYVNTLVLRHSRSAGTTLRQLLGTSKQLVLDAFANQDVPFEMLVEALRPPRSLAHAPLFQVQLSMQNNEQVALTLPGLAIDGIGLGAAQIKFDLCLTVREDGDQLVLDWSYSHALFDAATIERLAASFERFLGAALAAPDADLDHLPFAPAADLARLQAWNATRSPYPEHSCVFDLIAETARRTPDAIAVRDTHGALTYGALDAASAALARRLAARGIGCGDRVALCVDASAELLVALLGVQRSGAAYVPLDAKNTPQRLRAILDDAAPRAVLGVRGLAAGLDEPAHPLIELDGCLAPAWALQCPEQPLPQVPASASAYVIYTSGSTGTPKGVDIPHRGLTEYCVFASANYYRPDLSGSLVITSHVFDITVPSLYVPLLNGHCVHLQPQADILPRTAALLGTDATPDLLLRMTPMHAHALLALLPDGYASTARHVFVIGGERFAPALALALQARFPASTLYNHYGPSETVVGCCMYDISANLATIGAQLPIGSAMSNTCLHVLDGAMQPVPVGVAGELYIGGDCVGNGYLNRPELTERHFLANPLGPDWAPRLYRSGDLVRRDRHGQLVYLGRIDEQIKLRGFRIEPAEIESHIGQVPGVAKAVVLAMGEAEHACLVAYLQPQAALDAGAQEQLVERVRQALRHQLPDYLNPAAYVCMARLPLSANGKLDRRALPPPPRVTAAAATSPANACEAALRDIWAGVLAVDADGIGTEAGFFDLGGHSLLAVLLIEAVNRRFGASLTLSSLYQHSTIADQARLLAGATGPATGLVTLQAGRAGETPLFLIHPVGGDVLCYRELVQALALDCPVHGIEHAALSGAAPVAYASVEQLAARYCTLIRQCQPSGPYRLAGWSLGGVIAAALAAQLEAEGERVQYLGLFDSVLDQGDPFWQSLQQQVDDPEDVAGYLALLDAEADGPARFDRAYQLPALPDNTPDAGRARLRAVIVAGVVAARRCRARFAVRHLHYYGARDTVQSCGPAALERLLAMSASPAASHVFEADHFSLLRGTHCQALARQMRSDFLSSITS